MRIGQVAHRYLPSVGGIENYVYRLSRDLSRHGHEVEIFTTTHPPASSPAGVTVHAVRTAISPQTNPIPIGLFRQLQASKLDIVHFHSPWYLTSILPLLHSPPRSVMTVHGVLPQRHSITRDCALGLLYLPAFAAINRCASVIALTTSEQRRIRRVFSVVPKKLSVIPNAIDPDCCSAAGKSRGASIMALARKVLFVGRASKDSRGDLAILAYRKLLNDFPNSSLTLAGPGTEELVQRMASSLPKAAQAGLRGLGVVSRSSLCELYSSHAVLVSPGTWEGLPTRVLEAMFHGCVPVVSPSGGIPDLVSDRQNGVLLRRADPASIAHALRGLLGDHDLLTALSNASITTIRQKFLWPDAFAELTALYERLRRA